MNTHRAWMGADSTVTCFVRDEDGRRDLTDASLEVPVYAYGVTVPLLTLEASYPAEGKVTFTVTTEQTEQTFSPGLYRFHVEADGSVVYAGLLELV